MRIICITWTPAGSRRIIDISELLMAEIWNYSIFYKQKLMSILKYFIQSVMTLIHLIKRKPDIIVVQNPPIFAALICILFSRIQKTKIVIDHHLIWSMSGFIKNRILIAVIKKVEYYCLKKAYLNTTYADDWEKELEKMGSVNTITIYDYVEKSWLREANISIRNNFPIDSKIVLMGCGTGHSLEKPDILIEAGKNIKNLIIVVTGKLKDINPHIERAKQLKATNVIFPGFLSDSDYRGLIATCNFVANISDEPFGIPHTITEAFASSRPIIISNNPAIEKMLGKDYPLLIQNNDVESVRKGLVTALQKEEELTKDIEILYKQLAKRRFEQVKELFLLLEL